MVQAWAHYGFYLSLQATYNKSNKIEAKSFFSLPYLPLGQTTTLTQKSETNTLKNKKARKKKKEEERGGFSKLVSSPNQV